MRRFPFIQIAGVFESAVQVLAFIQNNKLPDVLFLDIDMPGDEWAGFKKNNWGRCPPVFLLLLTREFALEGFETAALDYIVKPLKADRFTKSYGKAGTIS